MTATPTPDEGAPPSSAALNLRARGKALRTPENPAPGRRSMHLAPGRRSVHPGTAAQNRRSSISSRVNGRPACCRSR
jgi:hypothetical protein